ncbi:MAG: hypothetical protein ACXQS2_02650 [Methermicoccaceae archaeon]
MRARLLHGKLMANKYSIVKEVDRYTAYISPGRRWTEMLMRFNDNEVYVIVETNNLKVATEVARKLLDLSNGDDLIYAEFTETGRLIHYIRIDLPPFFMEGRDPRRPRDREEIMRRSRILFYFDKFNPIDFEKTLVEYCFDFMDNRMETLRKFKEMIDKLGDDLLTMTIRQKLTEFSNKAPEWARERVLRVLELFLWR